MGRKSHRQRSSRRRRAEESTAPGKNADPPVAPEIPPALEPVPAAITMEEEGEEEESNGSSPPHAPPPSGEDSSDESSGSSDSEGTGSSDEDAGGSPGDVPPVPESTVTASAAPDGSSQVGADSGPAGFSDYQSLLVTVPNEPEITEGLVWGEDVADENGLTSNLESCLPALLVRAAKHLQIALPQPPPATTTAPWHNLPFVLKTKEEKTEALLPQFPGLDSSVEVGWKEPAKIKSSMAAIKPLTRVEMWSEPLHAKCPLVETALVTALAPEMVTKGKAYLPPADREVAKNLERSFEMASQGIGAASSMAILGWFIHSVVNTEAPTEQMRVDLESAAASIVGLSQVVATCSGGVMAANVSSIRNLWLNHLKVDASVKTELQEGPVVRESLFGPAVTSAIERCRAAEEAKVAHALLRPTAKQKPPQARADTPNQAPKSERERSKNKKFWQDLQANKRRRREESTAVAANRDGFQAPSRGRGRGRGRGQGQRPNQPFKPYRSYQPREYQAGQRDGSFPPNQ